MTATKKNNALSVLLWRRPDKAMCDSVARGYGRSETPTRKASV
jgi:hypothetical protein